MIKVGFKETPHLNLSRRLHYPDKMRGVGKRPIHSGAGLCLALGSFFIYF